MWCVTNVQSATDHNKVRFHTTQLQVASRPRSSGCNPRPTRTLYSIEALLVLVYIYNVVLQSVSRLHLADDDVIPCHSVSRLHLADDDVNPCHSVSFLLDVKCHIQTREF